MNHTQYLFEKVPQLAEKLTTDHKASFGLMTPQHMIEHLIWITKGTAKDFGEAPQELTKGQLGFMKFINNGAHFKYFESDKTEKDLPKLKYDSLEEAKENLPIALNRLKNFLAEPRETIYHPMMGNLTPDQLATFHYQHYKWHLERQFGLDKEIS